MDKELTPQQEKKIENLIKGLKTPKMSNSEIKTFMSNLDSLPEIKRHLRFPELKRRLYHIPKELFYRAQDIFARPIPILAGAASILVIFILFYFYALLPQIPALYNIKGTVKVFNARKEEWVLAKNRQGVRENDIIKTFQDGVVDIELESVYSMRLKKDSEIRVGRLNSRISKKAIRFEVAKGKVFAYYNNRTGKKGRNFELETGQVLASAVGTDFMLETIPKLEKTWLGVLDGVVRVTSVKVPEGISPEAATVYVESRYKTEAFTGKIPEKPQRMMEDEWLELKELYSLGRKPQVALLISTGSTRTRELLSLAPLYISDKEPSILPDKLTKMAKIFSQAVEERSKEKHVKAIREFEDIVNQYSNPVCDVPFLLFIGAYYEYIGEHNKAIETFKDVINRYPQSSLASIAQCAIGIIYEEKLHDVTKAKESYRKIINKYPESPEAKEAHSALNRLMR